MNVFIIIGVLIVVLIVFVIPLNLIAKETGTKFLPISVAIATFFCMLMIICVLFYSYTESKENINLLEQKYPPTKTTLKINDKYNEDFKIEKANKSRDVLTLKQNQVEFTIPFSSSLFSQLTLSYDSDYNKMSIPENNSNKINPKDIKTNSKATINISGFEVKFTVVENDIKHHNLVLQQNNTSPLEKEPIILKIKYNNKNSDNWISQLNLK